jgi:hypothetical protein
MFSVIAQEFLRKKHIALDWLLGVGRERRGQKPHLTTAPRAAKSSSPDAPGKAAFRLANQNDTRPVTVAEIDGSRTTA